MNGKEIDDLIWREKLRNRIFRIKERYHPELIMNLSREAHDRYVIRDSILSQILQLLDDTKISMDDIKQFIKEKIEERETKLEKVDHSGDVKLIEIAIEEWKSFL